MIVCWIYCFEGSAAITTFERQAHELQEVDFQASGLLQIVILDGNGVLLRNEILKQQDLFRYVTTDEPCFLSEGYLVDKSCG